MNVLALALIGCGAFALGSRFYGRWISARLGVDPTRPTPANELSDGRDYIPTRSSVVFAHHFSTIAGAGPIVGPTLAMVYGVVPVIVWVMLGAIFIGAVHDFTALFASLREGGKSVAELANKTMGRGGFAVFIGFTIIMLVLVAAVFMNLTATALTSLWPLEKLGLTAGSTILRTQVGEDGVVMGRIGGIASMSVIIVTLCAPVLGFLIFVRKIPTLVAYAIAAGLCVASVIVGIHYPVAVTPGLWKAILTVYVLLACGLPVWMVLQPRDFVNSQLLYGGMALFAVALLTGGLGGVHIRFPSINLAGGAEKLGMIWPMMFVTVACGAISGFHAMVSSGTTAKQCANEGDAKRIGYDGMLLEGALALFVILAIGSSLRFEDYMSVVWAEGAPNAALGFALATGSLLHKGLPFIPKDLATVFGILMLEGFLVTTLDSTIRLMRYLLEELWSVILASPPAFMRSYWFNAGLAVGLMWLVASTNAATAVWPVFGAANQLMAALTLIVVSVWLMVRGVSSWFTLVPAGFMMATTLAALALLIAKHVSPLNVVLLAADLVLVALALAVIAIATRSRMRWLAGQRGEEAPGSAAAG